MDWQNRFDRLLKAMSAGEPHKRRRVDAGKSEAQDRVAESGGDHAIDSTKSDSGAASG